MPSGIQRENDQSPARMRAPSLAIRTTLIPAIGGGGGRRLSSLLIVLTVVFGEANVGGDNADIDTGAGAGTGVSTGKGDGTTGNVVVLLESSRKEAMAHSCVGERGGNGDDDGNGDAGDSNDDFEGVIISAAAAAAGVEAIVVTRVGTTFSDLILGDVIKTGTI